MHLAFKLASVSIPFHQNSEPNNITYCYIWQFLPEFSLQLNMRKSTQNANYCFTCNSKINPIIHDSEDIFDIML